MKETGCSAHREELKLWVRGQTKRALTTLKPKGWACEKSGPAAREKLQTWQREDERVPLDRFLFSQRSMKQKPSAERREVCEV